MVGKILPEQEEIKVGVLTKKAQRKNFFFTTGNYKTRVFVLDFCNLAYYRGKIGKRGEVKGEVKLAEILAVETLTYKKSSFYGFQISYEEDGRALVLYCFAKTPEERDEWIQAIREQAFKSGAYFIQNYHPFRWHRHRGFACCGALSLGDEGCTPVTRQTAEMRERLMSRTSTSYPLEVLTDMMTKRSQGRSSLLGVINYKERVFVLDVRTLRYFGGNLKKREGLKGSIELSSIVAVENVTESLLDNRKNAFQVVYEDDGGELMSLIMVGRSGIKRQKWIQALREEAMKAGSQFQTHYHPGVWVKRLGSYNCCQNIDRQSTGCQAVTIDLQSYGSSSAKGGVKVREGMLIKRALSKRTFTSSHSYKTRLFVLNSRTLTYFDSKDKVRGEQKGSIALSCMEVVAPLEQGVLDGYDNAFQVLYWDDDDQQYYQLCLVASNSHDRKEWLADITSEAVKAGVNLSPYYHSGVWNKGLGKFTCCNKLYHDAQGCQSLSPSSPALPLQSSSSAHRPRSASSSSSLSSLHC